MSFFRFSLEQVLRYRKQLEEQAMLALTQARAARDKRRREQHEYARAIAEQQEKLTQIATMPAEERWLTAGYLSGLTHDHEQATMDLVALEEDVARCQAYLTQRAQDRNLLEKLKEKQAARHARMEQHHEQQTFDDIATIRFTPSPF